MLRVMNRQLRVYDTQIDDTSASSLSTKPGTHAHRPTATERSRTHLNAPNETWDAERTAKETATPLRVEPTRTPVRRITVRSIDGVEKKIFHSIVPVLVETDG